MNTKLHAVTDAIGRPVSFFMSAGQDSDYTGAAALLRHLPTADWLIADRGYDADWIRDALKDKGITPCIPGRKARKATVKYDKRRYKRRNRIEIMFGRLKDWRRIATRYDRCPKVFFSAIALAATVLFWL
ncbi:transposase [Roseinatronobacter bogoriensis subsp. barguzinensis]|nr:transposase [Rhodobaca bogoriensis DSM 18756]TDW37886.1 transposase [Rhodobaca barguzinensis]TDY69945.1 transposase [Rhodobaca bogoriensis DSM 18756]